MDDRIAALDFTKDFVEEFDRLYEECLHERFQPALANLTRALTALLDDKFPTSQRSRLHVDTGRIKSPNRLLLKAQTSRYRSLIQAPRDIFAVIRDIVGTRVTCNTVADVYAVIGIIKACATHDSPARTLFKLHEDWEDDYIRTPKESGYRAVNLIVGVPVPTGALMEPVICEIQIRTLLQYAWGELTHEDTYKPGVKVPDLVRALSKRLATALAVLDEIAQDLRNELDKLERPEPRSETAPEAIAPTAKEEHAEEPSVPEPSPVDQKVPGEPAPALPPLEPVEPQQARQLSAEDVRGAFQSAFGHDTTIAESDLEEIIKELQAVGFSQREEVAAALSACHDPIRELESQYEKIVLTDVGKLRAAIEFHKSPETGTAWVKDVLDKGAERVATKRRFETAYPVGRAALGTVVHVDWNYALVQLPEGDTGILHVTNMKAYPGEYVSVGNLVHAGDAVRIRILKNDPDAKRIELELIR